MEARQICRPEDARERKVGLLKWSMVWVAVILTLTVAGCDGAQEVLAPAEPSGPDYTEFWVGTFEGEASFVYVYPDGDWIWLPNLSVTITRMSKNRVRVSLTYECGGFYLCESEVVNAKCTNRPEIEFTSEGSSPQLRLRLLLENNDRLRGMFTEWYANSNTGFDVDFEQRNEGLYRVD